MLEDWQIKELTDIACKGMNKLAKEAPEMYEKLVNILEAYNGGKTGTLETIQELEGASSYYLYDHKPAVEDKEE